MPVAPLPQNTVHALGSGQVLTDSASLVKELIDNAIDARATTISVEISLNTLDDLRVKDNGHGIAPNDRALASIMHCTSKITSLDELRDIGGCSLGFRGQALASASELSKCLTISTRIEGEGTATELKFDRHGKIASEKLTSHPIGTTVRVERFLESLPVRRQAAEKTTTKTMTRIKSLLQAYALARPNLRLSLKILKAKNEKANWQYPKSAGFGNSTANASRFTAATDVVGKVVTDQCQWTPSRSSRPDEQIETTSDTLDDRTLEEGFAYEAILANPDCEASIISNIGQYISVDSRPVSCVRGTMKQIVSLYKSYLRSASANSDSSKITDPFLCMNIICPLGSYDVNIEPAKDEVLFTNADLLISLIRNLFTTVYGELQQGLPKAAAKIISKPSSIEVMLSRKKPPPLLEPMVSRAATENVSGNSSPFQKPHFQHLQQFPIPSESTTAYGHSRDASAPDNLEDQGNESVNDVSMLVDTISVFSPVPRDILADGTSTHRQGLVRETSMYADDDDCNANEQNGKSPSLSAESAPEDEAERRHLKSVHLSNPWAFAKLNAPFRPPHRKDSQQPINSGNNDQLPTPARQAGDAGNPVQPLSTGSPPDATTTGRRPRRALEEATYPSPSPFPFPLKARGRRRAEEATENPVTSNQECHAPGLLDTWVQKSSGRKHESINRSENEELDLGAHSTANIDTPFRGPFVSARSLPMGTPLSDIPDIDPRPRRKAPHKQQQRNNNNPYIHPVKDPERVWFETGEPRKRRPQQQPRPQQKQPSPNSLILREYSDEETMPSGSTTPSTSPIHPDLALTLDYEASKQLATQQHRASLRQQAKQPAADKGNLITTSRTSPHKNRQQAAIAALHTEDNFSNPSIFSSTDPRAYLIRTTPSSANPRKPTRRKTALLPLETLQPETYIGDLIHPITPTLLDIETAFKSSITHDSYTTAGTIAPAFSPPTNILKPQVVRWERTMKEMVKREYRLEGMEADEEMDGELDVDLWTLLQNHVKDADDA